MNRLIAIAVLLLGCAAILRAADKSPAGPNGVEPAAQPDAQIESFRRVLELDNPGLRLHALANITQLDLYHKLDDSFLPIFKRCAEDNASIIRSVTGRIVGTRWIEQTAGTNYNSEAVAILEKLAADDARDVRFSAIYYGLAEMKAMPDAVVTLLLKAAVEDRQSNLYGRIAEGLKAAAPAKTRSLLDKQLASKDPVEAVAAYEIYEEMVGSKPPDSGHFLKMPSSRPKLFVFKAGKEPAATAKTELETELKAAGIKNPDLFVSGTGSSYVLMLKTYLTEERLLVEQRFRNNDKFKITQNMWLTPELEIEIDSMKKAAN